jgi:predicted ATP-dependent endonuclease of OLD family
MHVKKLIIEGFRKHIHTTIFFSDSTFLIGENNVGKSSILSALGFLLSTTQSIPKEQYSAVIDETGNRITLAENIIFTAEFSGLPEEARTWRGFKGRIIVDRSIEEHPLTLKYRKTYPLNGSCKIEMLEYSRTLKTEFQDCNTLAQFLERGLSEESLTPALLNIDRNRNLNQKQREDLRLVDEIWDFNEDEENWVENPGGIPQNVLSKLPRYLLIPAQDEQNEISGSSGTLIKTLNELFEEVREASDNYRMAQEYLQALARELDARDNTTEMSRMIFDINNIVSDIFPNACISAVANLSDANKVIKPQFDIEMRSNISTSISLQGTGLIRSAVFALLRYKSIRDATRQGITNRPVLICFEEPEIFLHPNAINRIRDTIYGLADTANNQIVCTTHSPFMIDISRRPSQILNNLSLETREIGNHTVETISAKAFNVSEEFNRLQGVDREYIKMLLRVDDDVTRCFFVPHVLIVEGDTEQLVIRETLNHIPSGLRNNILSNWHILKARGKASIIPLVKYLKAMGIDIYVMHDGDAGTAGAEQFNGPIATALADNNKLTVLDHCIEIELGYPAPNSDKPYKAYRYISENWANWQAISDNWKRIIERIFNSGITIEIL